MQHLLIKFVGEIRTGYQTINVRNLMHSPPRSRARARRGWLSVSEETTSFGFGLRDAIPEGAAATAARGCAELSKAKVAVVPCYAPPRKT